MHTFRYTRDIPRYIGYAGKLRSRMDYSNNNNFHGGDNRYPNNLPRPTSSGVIGGSGSNDDENGKQSYNQQANMSNPVMNNSGYSSNSYNSEYNFGYQGNQTFQNNYQNYANGAQPYGQYYGNSYQQPSNQYGNMQGGQPINSLDYSGIADRGSNNRITSSIWNENTYGPASNDEVQDVTEYSSAPVKRVYEEPQPRAGVSYADITKSKSNILRKAKKQKKALKKNNTSTVNKIITEESLPDNSKKAEIQSGSNSRESSANNGDIGSCDEKLLDELKGNQPSETKISESLQNRESYILHNNDNKGEKSVDGNKERSATDHVDRNVNDKGVSVTEVEKKAVMNFKENANSVVRDVDNMKPKDIGNADSKDTDRVGVNGGASSEAVEELDNEHITVPGTSIKLQTDEEIEKWREERRRMWLLRISNNKAVHMKNMGIDENELKKVSVLKSAKKDNQFIQNIQNQVYRYNPNVDLNLKVVQREMATENMKILQMIEELGDAGLLKCELSEEEKNKLFGGPKRPNQNARAANRNNRNKKSFRR